MEHIICIFVYASIYGSISMEDDRPWMVFVAGNISDTLSLVERLLDPLLLHIHQTRTIMSTFTIDAHTDHQQPLNQFNSM